MEKGLRKRRDGWLKGRRKRWEREKTDGGKEERGEGRLVGMKKEDRQVVRGKGEAGEKGGGRNGGKI